MTAFINSSPEYPDGIYHFVIPERLYRGSSFPVRFGKRNYATMSAKPMLRSSVNSSQPMNPIATAISPRSRVAIAGVSPNVDGGRFPIKRIEGDRVVVQAVVLVDGHDILRCKLLTLAPDGTRREHEMQALPNDVWEATFVVDAVGRWSYTVEAWVDHFASWHRDLHKRAAAQQDLSQELLIGANFARAAAARAAADVKQSIEADADFLSDLSIDVAQRAERALRDPFFQCINSVPDRSATTRLEPFLEIVVDRPRARFGAWYEFFPRSTGPHPGEHGTFRTAETRLKDISDLGFDVVYLPPIHPIGLTHRKGKNDTETAQPGDVGSPWAIGNSQGGHMAIHSQLGTLEDFKHFVQAATDLKLEVALDLAYQCSPDHPYVQDHPEWFRHRPDGSIQYAENPPKKYQDIFPLDFDTADADSLWRELKRVVDYWIDQGIRIFRVDNPHTKPLAFWQWLIAQIKQQHPEVIFLSEAFTRPPMMYQLAKVGFTQSYNYFPWKNGKYELEIYFTEIVQTPLSDFFRYNLWPNTPDILTEYLQTGGPAAFAVRLVLAATLGASYGIYGPAFELGQNVPRHAGSEEYLNSEKYELKSGPVNSDLPLRTLMRQLNAIRRINPALQRDDTLQFHQCSDDHILFFSKQSLDRSNTLVIAVNLDPHHTRSTSLALPIHRLGDRSGYQVHELLTDHSFFWQGDREVTLDPAQNSARIYKVEM